MGFPWAGLAASVAVAVAVAVRPAHGLDDQLQDVGPHPVFHVDRKVGDWPPPVPELSNQPFVSNGGRVVVFEEAGGTWSGPDDHSSGFSFAWSEGALVLLATVLDDEHFHTGGSGYNFVWDGDAMQMLFTDAERSEVVSLINVARYDDGTVHVQYEQLPDGSDGAPPDPAITATVERDEARHTTTYEVSVPSVLLGHAALSEGLNIGVAIGINDGDHPPSEQGQRGWSGLRPDAIVYSKEPHKARLLVLAGGKGKARRKKTKKDEL